MFKTLGHRITEQIVIEVNNFEDYRTAKKIIELFGFRLINDNFHYAMPEERILTFEKTIQDVKSEFLGNVDILKKYGIDVDIP